MYSLAHTFRNPELARLAAIAARVGARMEGDEGEEDSAVALEKGLGKFFDANVSGDGDEKPARRVGTKKEEEQTEDEDDEEEGGERDDTDDDDDTDDESDDDEDGEESGDEGDADDSDDDDDESDEESDDDEDDEEGDDEEEEAEEESEFQRAAARTDLPTDFEDVVRALPKEARAAARLAFRSRLRQMEAGFGRAMTQARDYRKDESKHRAAREFAAAHPVEHIIELLDGDPKLLDKLNTELDARDKNPSHKRLRELEVKQAREAIESKAQKEEAELEKRMTRAQHVESFARKLCRKEGIPYEDAVEEALYAAIVSDPNRDISDSDLKNLVARKARVWHKHMGKKKRAERTQWVKDKVAQREKAKKRVTARDRSTPPAPGRQKAPKSLEEALMRRAIKIGIPESG